MKYEIEIDGLQAMIDLEERDGVLEVSVNDRPYRIKVSRPEAGIYLFFLGNDIFEARIALDHSQDRDRSARVYLKGRTFDTRLIDRKHRRGAADQPETGQQYVIAPMPGKVIRLLLEVGQQVAAGQGVVVIEAMKMQNELKSAKSGVLSDLRVKEADAVTAGQILAVVD
jgi:biotin carboxyl carrier protein